MSMIAELHHIAFSVQEFDWYVDFFQTVFDMTVRKTAGEKPSRKLWFHQGIQINETTVPTENGSNYDHFSLAVDDIEEAVKLCLEKGCRKAPNGDNWVIFPNNVMLEFMKS